MKLRSALRTIAERILGRLYEGPDPPPRLRESVLLFRVMQPAANADDWESFAIANSEEAYRSGFVRGLEWYIRELDSLDPNDPERLADIARNEWSIAKSSPRLREVLAKRKDPMDPFADTTPEQRAEIMARLAEYYGGFRVVVFPNETLDSGDGGAS